MYLLRLCFDALYTAFKPFVFKTTESDPEKAHKLLTSVFRLLYTTRTDGIVLNNSYNSCVSEIPLSNAAGFNKNGEIPPQTLSSLGFDRVVIGTVTYNQWDGNPRPRIKRYHETESLVNWMGLPGIGAKEVAYNISKYRSHDIPLTINLISTPGKLGNDLLEDLKLTIQETRDVENIDRYELNISCPNTHEDNGNIDARNEYKKHLSSMLGIMTDELKPYQNIYLKVSPDLNENDVEDIVSISSKYGVSGFTVANTTTNHNKIFIPENIDKGGSSGNAVYNSSLKVQKMFINSINNQNIDLEIIACGGINSIEKAMERIQNGAVEIQIFTPIIFSGTSYIRNLKEYFKKIL